VLLFTVPGEVGAGAALLRLSCETHRHAFLARHLLLQVKNAIAELCINHSGALNGGPGSPPRADLEPRRMLAESLRHCEVVKGIYRALQQDFFREDDLNNARNKAEALLQRLGPSPPTAT
jgi:hypothetical protein